MPYWGINQPHPLSFSPSFFVKKPMNHFFALFERLIEQWIEPLSEWENRFERFWVNVYVSWGIILLWALFAFIWTLIIPPLAFFRLLRTLGLFEFFWLGVFIGAVFYFVWKPVAQGRSIALFLLWCVILMAVWAGQDKDTTATAAQESLLFIHFCSTLYYTHPFYLGGWYGVCAWQTLVLVFRYKKGKQLHYWGIVVGGFILLIGIALISPMMGYLAALIAPHEFFNRFLQSPSDNDIFIRGSRLTPKNKAQYAYRKRISREARASEQTFSFGEVDVPTEELTTHLLAVGSSGSGKSLTLKLIQQACLKQVNSLTACRAVIFDPKHSVVKDIKGMSDITGDIISLNPFLLGAVRYDIAADFQTVTHAQAFADIMIPEVKGNQDPFFRDAAVNVLTGITLLFMINAPGNWRLSDIVRAFTSGKVLTALLSSHPETALYLNSLGSERTSANVLASVCAAIFKYMPVAALWEHATQSTSIREWLEGGQIWVLCEDEEAKPTVNALNRLILTRMTQSLLKETDYPQPRTFMFLDELQSIRVESLNEIATKGRSKGICLVMAFQSIQGMYECYGKEITESMMGQVRHKAFLKLSDVPTAEWASGNMGDIEIKRHQSTTAFQRGIGGLITWNDLTGGSQTIQQTRLVMPSEFINIPAVHPPTNQGLTGYYQTSINYKNYTSWDKLLPMLQPADNSIEVENAPPSWQRLDPWTYEDWERLGITEVMVKLQTEEESEDDTETAEYDANGGRYV